MHKRAQLHSTFLPWRSAESALSSDKNFLHKLTL